MFHTCIMWGKETVREDRTERSHEDYSLDNVILALLWEIETQKSPAVETLACMHTLPSHSHTGIKVQ